MTLRWQVAGQGRRGADDSVIALRPIADDAANHTRSGRAALLEEAFAEAGWSFELEMSVGGDELWARAESD